ncbi:MAG: type II toxin-antitoxin system RelB/DinJ family antitoxin [Streptococcaceae bacterium]|jgi:addiction module RelB/DinJ family antitoxin|nr:type II toxin-antitoxin system RelB/DinJ family antitoxin [Streptococcaceae bacterium]
MISLERNDRIAFRTNKELKEKATAILAKNQLDLSTALNMFLGKIVNDETLPLDFRTDKQKEAELEMIEKRLDAAMAYRKNGGAYLSLEEARNSTQRFMQQHKMEQMIADGSAAKSLT